MIVSEHVMQRIKPKSSIKYSVAVVADQSPIEFD